MLLAKCTIRAIAALARAGDGSFFGEMALLTGAPRQADVRALTYCRLLVLRKADFDRFMHENRDVRLKIYQIAETRASANTADAANLASL